MSEPHNHVSAGIDDDRRVEDDLNKVADEVANEGMTYRAARIRQGAIQLAFLRQSRTDAQAWQLPKSLPLEGFASQPSPAATVETESVKTCNYYMQRAYDAEADALRLHKEKMDMYERAIAAEGKLAAHNGSSAGSEQLETYDAWLAPETFHSLPMRERVHYTVKMLGSVNLTKEACDRQARRITDALEAAGLIPSEPQTVGMLPDRETFWLVERTGHGQYVKDRSEMPGLTSDPWRAERFVTEREAHDFWLRLATLRDECKPVEHMFINKVTLNEPQPSAGRESKEIAMTELKGTFACPTCGQDTPHHHTPEEIARAQPTVAGVIAHCRYRAKHLRKEGSMSLDAAADILDEITKKLERVSHQGKSP